MADASRLKRSLGWLVAFALAAVVTVAVVRVGLRGREMARRLACAANLEALGTAITVYGAGGSGAPIARRDTWVRGLVDAGRIAPEQLVCPATGEPYVLASVFLHDQSVGRACLIAYEPLANHGGEGGNILYADGHVEFAKADACKVEIAKLRAQAETAMRELQEAKLLARAEERLMIILGPEVFRNLPAEVRHKLVNDERMVEFVDSMSTRQRTYDGVHWEIQRARLLRAALIRGDAPGAEPHRYPPPLDAGLFQRLQPVVAPDLTDPRTPEGPAQFSDGS